MQKTFFPMLYFILRAAVLINLTSLCTECGAHTEIRIDEESKYFPYQDVYQAFKNITDLKDFYWLYGFNYNSNHTLGKTCVYFKIEGLSEHGMNYSSNFIKEGKNGTIPYTGTFLWSEAENYRGKEKREKFNTLHSEIRNSEDRWPMNYTLVFSDYKECSVFRVLAINNGHGCMVLAGDSAARKNALPEKCQSMYHNACDKSKDRFEKIFDNNCTKPKFMVVNP
ncbi:uncharacterized protein LOC144134862 [Amblyomma americanum]